MKIENSAQVIGISHDGVDDDDGADLIAVSRMLLALFTENVKSNATTTFVKTLQTLPLYITGLILLFTSIFYQ